MIRANGILPAIFAALLMFGLGGCTAGASSGKMAIVTITQGNVAHKFTAEIAETSEEQAQGLMYRKTLAPDAGMLFPFEKPKISSFYMKNTEIPLDIFFIRRDGTIDRIAENTVPLSEMPIVSGGEVAAVFEVNGGTAARLNIKDSAIVTWIIDGAGKTAK